MTHHHSDHLDADPVVLGKVNAELISRLKPYYESHPDSLLGHFLEKIKSISKPQYHGYVDTSKYKHAQIDSFSKREQVNRTIFALKKIKEFNHHFFNSDEIRIINPTPPGVLSHSLKWSFAVLDSSLLSFMWINWSFSKRNLAMLSGLVVSQLFLLRIPNLINESFQNRRRRTLAKKYIQEYGAEFFHNIIHPAFDVKQIAALENKLHASHHH